MAGLGSFDTVNVQNEALKESVLTNTEGCGADVVFEASGTVSAISEAAGIVCRGGCIVLVGMPGQTVDLDIVALQMREARIETVFRYTNVFPKVLELLSSEKIDVDKPITDQYPFEKSKEVFVYPASSRSSTVKVQITVRT
jgi:D-xylulose reductase